MLPSLAITLTLADDPRTQLEFWLEEAATVARGMRSEHDFSGDLPWLLLTVSGSPTLATSLI